MADEVTIRFGADTSDFEDGLNEVRGALSGVTPEIKKLSDGIGEAAQKRPRGERLFADRQKRQ